ncbi:stage III sporulation protein AF [Anoxybacter fermentans]|uniref:Stage III sporulation protein AF n=1 Tax=Anoxybacter fermentans TaxID=1323375 RepID=A0A3S9SYX5_9FIRM|nr:stage III sporulation protein AF [Anoxybacter fermentans]AZR73546.1 stage III sporulation protein AF [Anoxybacter fermentans]
MIEILKDWVRDLVIIVIFASLVEMLLPNSSIRKYLKIVISFFIFLTVLNPILSLIDSDFDVFYPFEDVSTKKEQQFIQHKGEAIKQHNRKLAITAFKRQLQQQIQALILTQPEVEKADVEVQVTEKGQIQSVQISLSIVEERKSDPKDSEIKPVKNVEISIGSRKGSEEKKKILDVEKKERIREKIAKLVMSFYNLKPEAISIQ